MRAALAHREVPKVGAPPRGPPCGSQGVAEGAIPPGGAVGARAGGRAGGAAAPLSGRALHAAPTGDAAAREPHCSVTEAAWGPRRGAADTALAPESLGGPTGRQAKPTPPSPNAHARPLQPRPEAAPHGARHPGVRRGPADGPPGAANPSKTKHSPRPPLGHGRRAPSVAQSAASMAPYLGREGKTGGEGEAQRRAQRRRLSCSEDSGSSHPPLCTASCCPRFLRAAGTAPCTLIGFARADRLMRALALRPLGNRLGVGVSMEPPSKRKKGKGPRGRGAKAPLAGLGCGRARPVARFVQNLQPSRWLTLQERALSGVGLLTPARPGPQF